MAEKSVLSGARAGKVTADGGASTVEALAQEMATAEGGASTLDVAVHEAFASVENVGMPP